MEEQPNNKHESIRDKLVLLKQRTVNAMHQFMKTIDPMLPASVRYALAATFAFGGGMGNVLYSARDAIKSVHEGVLNVGVSLKSGAKGVTVAAGNVHKSIQQGASSVGTSVKGVASISADGVKSVRQNLGNALKQSKNIADSVLLPCASCGNMPLATKPPIATRVDHSGDALSHKDVITLKGRLVRTYENERK